MRLFLALAAASLASAQILPQRPALGATEIVFSYAGDLWRVPRSGGAAIRLTTGPGLETYPVLSPDGKTVAFSGEYDGNFDVYTIPLSGGIPQRITYHPDVDEPTAFSPDGQQILFRSARSSYSRFKKLFLISATGGPEQELPLGMAVAGAWSPNGQRMAYMPIGFFRAPHSSDAWKHYRGGRTTKIWIADLKDSAITPVPRANSNDSDPMWIGNEIYFLSDRDGAVSLYAHTVGSQTTRRVIENKGLDYKSASAGPGAIVLERFGALELWDLKTKKLSPISITVTADLLELRPRLEKVSTQIRSLAISPTGQRAVAEARGEILSIPAAKGDPRNLSQSPAAHDRSPAWSPDGKTIAWISDESGAYGLVLRQQNGLGEKRFIKLEPQPGYYFSPKWSPDGKWIALEDNRLNLWVVDIAAGSAAKIATDTYYNPTRTFDAAWSPDSQYLAYTKALPSHLHSLFVYSTKDQKTNQLSDGLSDVRFPTWDKDARHLYFTASTNIGATPGFIDMSIRGYSPKRSAYVMVLRNDTPSPLAPESDDEAVAKVTPETNPTVRIDFDGLSQRILALPIPPLEFTQMQTGKHGVVFLLDETALHRFDLAKRKAEKFADKVGSFEVSFDGEKVLFSGNNQVVIASAAAPWKPGDGIVKLSELEVHIDPRAEFKQMYNEAWRMQREYFYDPKLHGANAPRLADEYAKYVDAAGARADLNYLLTEMLGHLSIGHLYIRGGAVQEGKKVTGGLLGADYEVVNGRYRFKKIYNGENWNPQLRAPLTQPGVNVRPGETLFAVNGVNVTADRDIAAYFEGKADRSVVIKVGTDPATARELTVTPVPTEQQLRYFDWVEGNRRKVDLASGGRLAYIYMPDTGDGGYTNFVRYYFAQAGKQGVVLDERFNGGGQAADYVIDVLRREPMNYWRTRYGAETTTPVMGIYGPRVMIVNEFAGSGGDAMPYYFRQQKLGPLVGTKTWGGLVGILGYPVLMDGGTLTAPNFAFRNLQGQFDVENVGVAPDIEVWQDPKLLRQGQDPQLDRAIAVALEALEKSPKPRPAEPVYPVYN